MNTAPPGTRIVQTAYVMWGGGAFLGRWGSYIAQRERQNVIKNNKISKTFRFSLIATNRRRTYGLGTKTLRHSLA